MRILNFIFLFLSSNIFAQTAVDSLLNSSIQDLNSRGITEFFYYERYCDNGIRQVNEIDCMVGDSRIFLFWRKNEESFVEQLNCSKRKVKIGTKIIDFYKDNYGIIENEEVEIYKTKKDSIVDGKTHLSISMISHSCLTKFLFFDGQYLLNKTIDDYDLSNKKNSPNINYQHNKTLKLVHLADLCKRAIQKIK